MRRDAQAQSNATSNRQQQRHNHYYPLARSPSCAQNSNAHSSTQLLGFAPVRLSLLPCVPAPEGSKGVVGASSACKSRKFLYTGMISFSTLISTIRENLKKTDAPPACLFYVTICMQADVVVLVVAVLSLFFPYLHLHVHSYRSLSLTRCVSVAPGV